MVSPSREAPDAYRKTRVGCARIRVYCSKLRWSIDRANAAEAGETRAKAARREGRGRGSSPGLGPRATLSRRGKNFHALPRPDLSTHRLVRALNLPHLAGAACHVNTPRVTSLPLVRARLRPHLFATPGCRSNGPPRGKTPAWFFRGNMKGKGKAKAAKGGKGKKGGSGKKVDVKALKEESEADRAKAAASLWEARLEVTEISRKEYRAAARRLAQNNEELERQQRRLERDTVDVIGYLKKQDVEKEDLIEKLKLQLNEVKQKAKEENDELVEHYTKQLEEMEEKFNKKAKEIGLIQVELKMIMEFRKKKALLEKQLEDLNEIMEITEKEHQETICMLEKKFLEEKQRLEREAEKKIYMLAERAHHEAIMQLDAAGKAVFQENVRLHEALGYHMKETEELQKAKQKLEEKNAFLLQEKETNELLVQEKIRQITQQKTLIQDLQNKVKKLEDALYHMTREFKTEVESTQQKALMQNQAGQTEIVKLQQLLEMKEREMSRVKKLARNILDQRTEVEKFFLDALEQVKQEIITSRKCYKQVAQDAYQRKMMAAFAGKDEYPKIRTFNNNEHSTNSVQMDLLEAEKWTNIQKGKLDISDLTWEQKESVLRLLFAKMNGLKQRKYGQALVPITPDTIKLAEPKNAGTDDTIPVYAFITQQAPVSESPRKGSALPDIQVIPPQSN
ncbi:basal body-orientation factor 1 [Lacerta agilis]|uniref:basal body-orientation factor 1 n=1 Tax=Lacerta agilis TaxID=80427 RepID=UPI0014195321|nr:basal body-orientation factor 1 [Lacerta agilis]